MKKKVLSLALALATCLGLMAPAFAAETKEVREDISLTGIVREEMIPGSPVGIPLYELESSATLVINGYGKTDEFNTARKASIVATICEAAQNGTEEPADWDWDTKGPFIPGEWRHGEEIANLEWTQNVVYAFDQALAGKTVFLELNEEWESIGDGGNGLPAAGTTEILLRFAGNGGTEPQQPAKSETAMPTNDKLTVNGQLQNPTVYKINGNNYFKIRDLAAVLNGTEKQFDVGYDSALKSVTATTGKGYAKLDTDLAGAATGGNQTADPSNDTIYIDGQKIDAAVYKINGNNYFKLRDLGEALNFYVGWTQADGVFIDTTKPYSK